MGEVLRAADDLVRAGKVLYLGAANVPAWVVSRADLLAEVHGWTPFSAIQVEYSLIERDPDRELVPMARKLGIGVAAWTPLASGWLTGKYLREPDGAGRRLDDALMSRFLPRTERNVAVAREVRATADEIGCSPAHVALNWLRDRGAIPVFGATSVAQVEENCACCDFGLSAEQVDRLNKASRIVLGFPHEFLASGLVRRLMYGEKGDLIDTGLVDGRG
jgi:aryl-alcohol dehydrogenase-like predicted oxidoreductase